MTHEMKLSQEQYGRLKAEVDAYVDRLVAEKFEERKRAIDRELEQGRLGSGNASQTPQANGFVKRA